MAVGEKVFGVCHTFVSFNDMSMALIFLARKSTARVTGRMKVKAGQGESSPYTAILATQNMDQRFKELGIPALHIKFQATGGKRTKTPGPGSQSALRALACSGMKIKEN